MEPTKKILIIDDDNGIRKLLACRLASLDYEPLMAESGCAGLTMAKDSRPDLVILDLRLPGIPGEEICKAIREDQDKQFAKTPIIMLTSKTDDVDRVIGKVVGANCYMTKPFKADELAEQIHKLT